MCLLYSRVTIARYTYILSFMHPIYNSITGQMALLTRYNLAIILYAVAPSFEIVSLHPVYFATLLGHESNFSE